MHGLDDPSVGESLRDLIDRRSGELGLNIKQIAARAETSDRTIRAWRSGENAPGPVMLTALGRALGGRIVAVGDGTFRFLPGGSDDVAHVRISGDDGEGGVFLTVDPVAWARMTPAMRRLAIARAEAAIAEVQVEAEHRRPQGDPDAE